MRTTTITTEKKTIQMNYIDLSLYVRACGSIDYCIHAWLIIVELWLSHFPFTHTHTQACDRICLMFYILNICLCLYSLACIYQYWMLKRRVFILQRNFSVCLHNLRDWPNTCRAADEKWECITCIYRHRPIRSEMF